MAKVLGRLPVLRVRRPARMNAAFRTPLLNLGTRLWRIEFGVGTADSQHLSIQQPRRRVTYGLQQAARKCPTIGRGIVQPAVGRWTGMAAVNDDRSGKQHLTGAKQRQGT